VTAAELSALQRRLHAADGVAALLARAPAEACAFCGYGHGVVLPIQDGHVVAGSDGLDDPVSDGWRRRVAAAPVRLVNGTPEGEAVRRAEGAPRFRATKPSRLGALLELSEPVLSVVAPEGQALAMVVLGEPRPEAAEDRVELCSHLLGLALDRAVLRDRMRALAGELRYLTTSAGALVREALEAPVLIPGEATGVEEAFRDAGLGAHEWRELLSERELEIARLLAAGRTNREIGTLLNLSPETVKGHVARLLTKLGAANRVQAATRFLRLAQ
jgi:DNA-binding CsgD family transcriptional regulator